jgi:DNA-binding CsgD family transcriptional regulator
MEGYLMPSANEGQKLQADLLADRFNLAHAEARLVVHLVQGASLKSSAEALGVKYETARSHLKSVFLKTGTHRQAELVLKVFDAMSHPNPSAVPAAMAAQELRPSRTEEVSPRLPIWGTMSNKAGTPG